jgi:guanosine-3',5'-bis(diphosphate) 3'-pyrophosphohydrolase
VSHVYRVAMTVTHVFGIQDLNILTAAVLHDTLEDTATDFSDLKKDYGERIAKWVAQLSKDKTMPDPQRESAYKKQLDKAPPEVKLIKLADIHDNLLDAEDAGIDQLQKTLQKAEDYLKIISKDQNDLLTKPCRIVKALINEMEQNVAIF